MAAVTAIAIAAAAPEATSVELKHVNEDGRHGLMMGGATLVRFKGGLSKLLELANEVQKYVVSDDGSRNITSSIKFIQQWIQTNSIWPNKQQQTSTQPTCTTTYNGEPVTTTTSATTSATTNDGAFIGQVDAYELGWAIGNCLSSANQLFEFMVKSFKIPKTLAEWKTCSDEKCNNFYQQISKMVYGLTVLRGYIEEIRLQYPFFQSELPPKTPTTLVKPIVKAPDDFMMGVYEVEDLSYAIIGDCHPEYWMTKADRTPLGGYIGSKRNCTNLG
jgi:hypothetical protein